MKASMQPAQDIPLSLKLAKIFTGMFYDLLIIWKFLFELIISVFAIPTLFIKVSHDVTMILFAIYAVDRFQEHILPTKEQLESMLTPLEREVITEADRNAYFYRIFLFFRICFSLEKMREVIIDDFTGIDEAKNIDAASVIRYNYKLLFALIALSIVGLIYIAPAIPFLSPLYGVAKLFCGFLVDSGVKLEIARFVTPMFGGFLIYSFRAPCTAVGLLISIYLVKPLARLIVSCFRRLKNYCFPAARSELTAPFLAEGPRSDVSERVAPGLASTAATSAALAAQRVVHPALPVQADLDSGAGLGFHTAWTPPEGNFYDYESNVADYSFFKNEHEQPESQSRVPSSDLPKARSAAR